MFKLNPNPTFNAKVSLLVPGSESPAIIDIEFKHKGRTAFTVWWESIDGRKDDEILAEIIVGWNGPLDDKGDPVAYSPSALAQLIDNYPAAAIDLHAAYRKALWDSRAKN